MRRKKYLAIALVLSGVMVFSAGCGNNKKEEAKSVEDTADQDTAGGDSGESGQQEAGETGSENNHEDALNFKSEDYVKLGEYKNLKVQYPVPEVFEEDVEYAIQELQDENTEYQEITDRPSQEGDSVNIDYTGTMDGEEFEGGSDKDYELVLGSGDFLEDFENSLIGKNKGEVVTFPLTFPEEYFDSEAEGKQAEFTVTINKISEVIVPEYTDEFVAKVTDYKTTEEYEDYIRGDLMITAQEESASASGEDALALAVENAEVNGYPQELYDFYYDETVAGYQFYASMMGMEYEEFLEQLGEGAVEDAVLAQVEEYLVAQAIADKEGLTVTDEGYQEEVQALLEEYEYDTIEELEEDYGKTSIITQIIRSRVVNFLYENAEVEEVSQDEYYGEDESEDEDTEDGEEAGEGELELETDGEE
jgi:trigger factor